MNISIKQKEFLNRISRDTRLSQILLNGSKYNNIRLTFAYKNSNGHMGARKFWHTYIPTLKFYNPSLGVEVERLRLIKKGKKSKTNRLVDCKLEMFDNSSNKVLELDMRNKMSDAIMKELLEQIEYTQVPESDLVEV